MTPIYKVICVDDNADSCELVEVWLTAASGQFDVSSAHTAHDALNLLEHSAFDLFILDIYLPEVSGLALCNMIRGKYPEARILMFSADSYMHAKALALNAGANAFLPKPVVADEFISTVNGLLDGSALQTNNR